jgi:hypothetical protein
MRRQQAGAHQCRQPARPVPAPLSAPGSHHPAPPPPPPPPRHPTLLPRDETRNRLEAWRVKVAEALDSGELKEPPPGYIRPGEEPAYEDRRRGGDDDDDSDEPTSSDSASEGAQGAAQGEGLPGARGAWPSRAQPRGRRLSRARRPRPWTTVRRPTNPPPFTIPSYSPAEEPDGIAVAAALKSKTDCVLNEDEANVTSGRGAFDVMLTTYSLFERESQRHT